MKPILPVLAFFVAVAATAAPHPSRQALLEQLQQQQAARSGAPGAGAPADGGGAGTGGREARGGIADISGAEVPRDALLREDIAWLDNSGHAWHHLRTTHFVIHYEKKIFAAKVARLAEAFYDYISADLPPGFPDRMDERLSHIFVFADPRAWSAVISGTPGLTPLTASFVRNQTMYLQEWGDSSSEKMSVLAHEMTHLVLNRFLEERIPLWLNEGLAEYYGEFAYRAVRGMGQSKSSAFPPAKELLPLKTLFALKGYPPDSVVLTFYRTAKYLVGFLRLRHGAECWNEYFTAVAGGAESTGALLEAFSWAGVEEMEGEFRKFAR